MKLSTITVSLMMSLCLSSHVSLAHAAPEAEQTPTMASQAERVDLSQLFNDYNTEFLSLNPFLALFQGNSAYNHAFGDYLSDDYLNQSRALTRKYYQLIKSVDTSQLNQQDKISHSIFLADREREMQAIAEGLDQLAVMLPINQFVSIASYMPIFGSGQSAQPFRTVEDYDNWLKRAGSFPRHVDQAIGRMREGMKHDVVLPKVLAVKVLPQLRAHVVENVEKSAFYQPVRTMPESFSDEDRTRLTQAYQSLIVDQLVPAYAKYAEFFEKEYIPNARDTHGLSGLPKGKALYRNAIQQFTSTNMSADEIHDIGLEQGRRLYAEMESVKKQVGFDGSMQDFFAYLNSDPTFFYSEPEELLAGYESLREVIDPQLDALFSKQPKTNYVIRAIEPFRAQSAAAAQYFPGAADGSRPGVFYVNTHNLDTRPKWLMNALSIHEASPGHHFQISLNYETQALPPFRQFSNYTAYTEGWGLYSETLGKEMGVYEDPYQYFGMLYLQILRANRLVVDTGLHAKGWTREQAIEYMLSNSPMAENEAVAEVERYMALPGQALAYMVGKLKIDELRAYAKQALGEQFSLAEFHYQVLKDGSMPLSVLELKVKDWVSRVKSA